jgi:hypothetical protein
MTFHSEDHSICGSLANIQVIDDNTDIKACFVYVGVGGDLNVIAAGDTTSVILKNVPTGSLLPIKITRVKLSNTTASSLVAVR